MDRKPTYEELEQKIHDITEQKQAEGNLRDSEERYRTILESIEEAYFEVDLAGNFTVFNDSLSVILGYSQEELKGMNNRDYMPPETAKEIYNLFKEIYRKEKPIRKYGYEVIRKGGTQGFHELFASLMRDGNGKPIGFRGIAHDITERKQAEEKLREAEEKFRGAFEDSLTGMILGDKNGRYIQVNKALSKILGYSQKELLSLSTSEITYPGDVGQDSDMARKLWAGESDGFTTEKRYIHKDGHVVWSETTVSPVRDAEGKTKYRLGQLKDITERKKAEETLRESEERYRTILESIDEGYYEVDLKGNFTFVNNSMCKIRGSSRDELIGMNNREYMDQKTAKRVYRKFNEVYRTGKPVKGIELESIRKDGTKRYVESSASLLKDLNGIPIGFRGIVADITERKLAEEAFRRSENKYRTLIKNAGEAIIVAQDGIIKFANPKGEKLYGHSQEKLASKPLTDFIHEKDREMVGDRHKRRLRGQKAPTTYAFRIINKAGDTKWVQLSAVPFSWDNRPAVLCYMTDITERKQAEEALQKRVKELTCLYAVSRDMQKNLSIDEFFRRAVEHLVPAMQFPEITTPVIELNGRRFTSENYTEELSQDLHADIRVQDEANGHLRVYYAEGRPFLIPEEQNLVNSFAEALSIWLEHKQTGEALKDREQELRRKSKRLEEINTALNVLLKKRDDDKLMIEEKVLFNVKELIEPLIENLKNSGLDENQTSYVNTLETFLTDIVSPFSQTLHNQFMSLTPTEIRIANMVKAGKSTKEIASLLNSSKRAVEFHRHNIRAKLGLKNIKANLVTRLSSLQ